MVKMPDTLANKKYADMHFIYDFCRGNRRATVVE
jgi:hypothetical protein